MPNKYGYTKKAPLAPDHSQMGTKEASTSVGGTPGEDPTVANAHRVISTSVPSICSRVIAVSSHLVPQAVHIPLCMWGDLLFGHDFYLIYLNSHRNNLSRHCLLSQFCWNFRWTWLLQPIVSTVTSSLWGWKMQQMQGRRVTIATQHAKIAEWVSADLGQFALGSTSFK